MEGITNERVYREACARFLPTTVEEMRWRGWDELDVLLVTGDAYVDHPTFGVPCVGRWLEKLGFRVGIVAQPEFPIGEPAAWSDGDPRLAQSVASLARMGRPRLFAGIASGTVDSLINNYTANRKPRSDDMYSEGGQGGRRPDYATTVYAALARRAFPDLPILAGGVEASLRRLAHYDYWQDRVRPSILHDWHRLGGIVDLLVFGMGERQVRLAAESLAEAAGTGRASLGDEAVGRVLRSLRGQRGIAYHASREEAAALREDGMKTLVLPSYDQVRTEKRAFARAAYHIEYEASPFNGKRLIQFHGNRAAVVNPPALPLSTAELDAIYELPFTKEQHPRYRKRVPAADMIRFSVTSTRGCFGGCSFCAITLHHGRVVQSRSEKSVLREIEGLNRVPGFTGIVSDVGGPTANMWMLRCRSPEIQSKCRKLSCVHPKACPQLHVDHAPLVSLLRKARAVKGIRKVRVSSGLRYDLAFADRASGSEYLRELISHHVGGQLKVAPEHLDEEVLHLMKKPGLSGFSEFVDYFQRISREAGKEQYVVPYFISGFPGSTHEKMEKVTAFLRARGWSLQQVQAFMPTPMTLATAMYHTGLNPMGLKPLFVAKSWKDRKIQQALLQPSKPSSRRWLDAWARAAGS